MSRARLLVLAISGVIAAGGAWGIVSLSFDGVTEICTDSDPPVCKPIGPSSGLFWTTAVAAVVFAVAWVEGLAVRRMRRAFAR